MGFETVYGVDFSGAREAGENIWVSEVDVTGDEPAVVGCQPATAALEDHYVGATTTDREATLDALVSFVASRPAESVVGFDFPFSVSERAARGAFDAETWEEVLDAVADCAGADEYAEACAEWAREHTDGTYLKRDTDEEWGAFSPYHFFVNAQAYHGMADVLAELRDETTVVPFDALRGDPVVAEVYPAATLDVLGLCREGYKGDDPGEQRRRKRNLEGVTERADLSVRPAVRDRIIADSEGDALDSLVAAVAALRNAGDFDDGDSGVEGRIYV
ncbi:uncharacterized protein HHUB_1434 [Halobacterium hubeiense]|uniref:DUF429 family protein n=1 Tax=Halobacterium hubeiense TaxID=1407499 RepID=A0A0U5CVN2_9EURY|nr:DUF429 domain-containing protein [Halobacterium hubeiense]CQH48566.1 uncharacterized protein HHUB_1434 [Halobacterium hubeiense]